MERAFDVASRAFKVRGTKIKLEAIAPGVLIEKPDESQEADQTEYAPEKGWSCPMCRDWGIIPYTIRKPLADGQHRDYQTNARCRCQAGIAIPNRFPTYYELFGVWPDGKGGPEPRPQPLPIERPMVYREGKWIPE